MKQIILIIIILFLIVPCKQAKAQWVNTGKLYGGVIKCLAVNRYNILAGTEGGIFLSTNNGENWRESNLGLTDYSIQSLTVSGTNIFIGTSQGVHYSSDYGNNWTEINNGIPITYSLTLASEDNNIYAGGINGVFLTTNNGQNWTEINNGLTNKSVFTLAANNGNIFAGTNDGVFHSNDNGKNWTARNAGLTDIYIRYLYTNNEIVFASTYSKSLFISTNNGGNWTEVKSNMINQGVSSIQSIDDKLYACTPDGLFFSLDNGKSWNKSDDGITCPNVYSIAANGNNLFAGTSTGVFVSTDSGMNWSEKNYGISNTSINVFTFSGTSIFAGTSTGMFRSVDNGVTWKSINKGLIGSEFFTGIDLYSGSRNISIYALAINGMNLFAGTNNGVFVSTDYGDNWKEVNNGLSIKFIRSFAVGSSKIFAGTAAMGDIGGLYLSSNGGMNWTYAGLGNSYVTSIAIKDTNIFAYAASHISQGLLRSSNDGKNWMEINNGISNISITSLVTIDNDLFAGSKDCIYFTTDDGTNWIKINDSLVKNNVNSLITNGKYLFAATNNGITLSTNSGINWIDATEGSAITSGYYTKIGANNDYLFTSFKNEIWRSKLSEIITGVKESNLPPDFYLAQNYPNPFNPTTKIRFSLPYKSNTKFVVYDILGREIKELINQELDAGYHETIFNAGNLSSGVYFYRISTENFTSVKKLLLIK